MKIQQEKFVKIENFLLMELGDKKLVENMLLTIKLYQPPLADEVLVDWESEWSNKNQVTPWFAIICITGNRIKRNYLDCITDYKPADNKIVQKRLIANLKIGSVVEYVEGGNSKRTIQYYGIITQFGLYRIGEIDDGKTLIDFLKIYDEDILEQYTEEHELLALEEN